MPSYKKSNDAQKGYPLPSVVNPADSINVCVPIPNDPAHIRAFTGQLDMLGYWFTWERDTDKTGKDCAAVWRAVVDVVRQNIEQGGNCSDMANNCCVEQVILHRINTETGRLEISIDGGETWTQDPQDPGISSTPLLPPVTTGLATDKCNAAANASNDVSDWVSNVSAAKTNAATLAEFLLDVAIAILAVITLPPAAALIIPIVFATMKVIFGLTVEQWEGYFTTDVYDVITCAFFCAMNDDGSLDETGYGELLLYLEAHLPAGEQKNALIAMLKARGWVGCNNMASFGTGTADCSDCSCTCTLEDWVSWMDGIGGTVTVEEDPELGAYIHIVSTYQGSLFGGYWGCAITTNNIYNCCHVIDTRFTGSTGGYYLWRSCGLDIPSGPPYPQYGNYIQDIGQINFFAFVSSTPFTMDVFFE